MGRHAVASGIAMMLAVVMAACGGGGTDGSAGPDPSSPNSPSPSPTVGSDAADGAALALRFGTVTERDVDGGADGRSTTDAVTAMNDFAVDLYRSVLADQEGNLVVGPYSVAFALSMLYAGASGGTADEIADVLHATGIDPDAWHEGVNAYDLTLDARTAGSSTRWASANKVWTTPGLPLRADYLDVLTGAYGSPLAELDFAADPDAARDVVNDWVGERTFELVPELWPPDSFGAQTRMVLVNAVAMDAPWEFPFDPSRTTRAPFRTADGATVQVPTMRYDEYLPALRRDGLQAVELPYGDGALSMVVIVPDDLAAFEAELSASTLAGVIDDIGEGGIHLSIPKWSSRTHLDLNETLAAIGMPTAFTPAADFSGMVDDGGLWVDRLDHEAYVDVDEQGTRAAAATGAAMVDSHGPTISVDRPFLYLVRDRGAGTILFIGRILDPTDSPR